MTIFNAHVQRLSILWNTNLSSVKMLLHYNIITGETEKARGEKPHVSKIRRTAPDKKYGWVSTIAYIFFLFPFMVIFFNIIILSTLSPLPFFLPPSSFCPLFSIRPPSSSLPPYSSLPNHSVTITELIVIR